MHPVTQARGVVDRVSRCQHAPDEQVVQPVRTTHPTRDEVPIPTSKILNGGEQARRSHHVEVGYADTVSAFRVRVGSVRVSAAFDDHLVVVVEVR